MLDPLSKQLIKRSKAFQAVVRLGTYSGKVPSYSLKAHKGTMFFSSLPLGKTLKTIEDVGNNADIASVGLRPLGCLTQRFTLLLVVNL